MSAGTDARLFYQNLHRCQCCTQSLTTQYNKAIKFAKCQLQHVKEHKQYGNGWQSYISWYFAVLSRFSLPQHLSSTRIIDTLGHPLMPQWSACCKLYNFIPRDADVLQVLSCHALPVFRALPSFCFVFCSHLIVTVCWKLAALRSMPQFCASKPLWLVLFCHQIYNCSNEWTETTHTHLQTFVMARLTYAASSWGLLAMAAS